jgi:amino-acid N-acetyltransferase
MTEAHLPTANTAVAQGEPPPVPLVIEKARVSDAQAIYDLVNGFADHDEMLHRPLSEIYENLRDYFVARLGEEVVGCVALHLLWSDLGELRAMAVAEHVQRHGVGRKLVAAVLEEAERMGLSTVFCLTKRPGFFAKTGFQIASVHQLPRKVWGECFRCVKFPKHCDEVAMVIQVGPPRADQVGMYQPTAQPVAWLGEIKRGEGVVAQQSDLVIGER